MCYAPDRDVSLPSAIEVTDQDPEYLTYCSAFPCSVPSGLGLNESWGQYTPKRDTNTEPDAAMGGNKARGWRDTWTISFVQGDFHGTPLHG